MNILAFDTSAEACSVALLVGQECLQKVEQQPRKQAELLLPMIESLLAEAGISLQQLDGLAVTRGPGAFTGVRIGIGVAQGISYGLDLPTVSVSSLAVIAQGVYRAQGITQVLAAIDARMKEVYWGGYFLQEGAIMSAIIEDRLSAPENISQQIGAEQGWTGAGSAWREYASVLPSYPACPEAFAQAQDIISLAMPQFIAGNVLSAAEIAPVYLRDKVI